MAVRLLEATGQAFPTPIAAGALKARAGRGELAAKSGVPVTVFRHA